MRTLNNLLLLLLALGLGAAPAYAQIEAGSCLLGTSVKDMDVNNIRARLLNTGSLFFGAGAEADYIVPQASGNSAIFASGIWIGGLVDGDLRTAGSRYEDFEYWPGPLLTGGRLPNSEDCSAFDRIYKVSRRDIQDYEAGAPLDQLQDLRDWPATLGAPVLADVATLDEDGDGLLDGNDVDDDGDGLVDEGVDGIDNDEDGSTDERDEQERVVCRDTDMDGIADVALDGGPCYDLEDGDRPDIIGDQSLWWVMNDVGNQHDETDTPPIGVEVRVQAFAFSRDNALGNTTFYSYTVEYFGEEPLTDAYLTVFSDPDLGDAGDDFVGSDTTLSLGYVYNGDRVDSDYGVPPAAGYDFFQGPIVDGDTLGLTSFNYFINDGPPALTDPMVGEEYYNVMQGLAPNGKPITAFGNGITGQGEVTQFAFPGNPVDGDFWSEVNNDREGGKNPVGDRRLTVTTGPFTINSGDVQEIVFGIVFAQGSSALGSVAALRAADITAQAAYDADFEVPEPPPAPRLCTVNNPELLPGSGNCLEAGETDDSAVIVWGYPESSTNYLGQFMKLGYSFEGFNIYQYPTRNFDQTQRRLVATFDKINGITRVANVEFNTDLDRDQLVLAASGTDSGLQYFYVPTSDVFTGNSLVNYTDYYFGVSAYGVNLNAPRELVVESSPTQITIRPSNIMAANGGSQQQSDITQVIIGERNGEGIGAASAIIVDPTRLTGATYTVELVSVELPSMPDSMGVPTDTTELITYNVFRDGTEVFSGERTLREDGIYVSPIPITTPEEAAGIEDNFPGVEVFTGAYVIDGLQFVSVADLSRPEDVGDVEGDRDEDFAGDGDGIVEIATPSGQPCAGASAVSDIGCQFYGGNTVWLDPDAEGQYLVTNPENDRVELARSTEIKVAAPDNFEMRFTDACSTADSCFGAYASVRPGNSDQIVSVPFELWNVGRDSDPGDDVRMIPILLPVEGGEALANWADMFPGTQDVIDSRGSSPTMPPVTLYTDLPITDRVIAVMPDRPNGYDLFATAAAGFGGGGSTYDPENDGDTQVDLDSSDGDECASQNYYADFCYMGAGPRFVGVIGGNDGFVIGDVARDGTTPEAGTTIQFQTVPKGPVLNAGDQFTFDTSQFNTVVDAGLTEEALDMIGIVPNPYRGRSAYETGSTDRRARFTNLPPQVTIRIYTVAGTLIKTLNKSDASRSLDWDLTTTNNLPVASGMYIIHVQARSSEGGDLGERVLKFGVINRQIDVDVF